MDAGEGHEPQVEPARAPADEPSAADAPPPPGPPGERKVKARKAFSSMVEIIGLIVAIPALVAMAAGGWSLLSRDDPGPPVIEADLGVVVAEFSTAGGEDVVGVSDLSQSFSSELETELTRRAAQPASDGSSLEVEVQSSAETDPLDGGSVADLAEAAEDLAAERHADLLITATVSEDRREVTPYLFVMPAAVPDAIELSGLHPLGSPITTPMPVDENRAARADVRAALTERVSSTAEMAIGLHRYGNLEFPEAEARFENARELLPDPEDDGLVLLFLGNTALKQEQYPKAAAFYQEGLGAGDEVAARLELGLAEVAMHQNKGVCTADPERERTLTGLQEDYQEILSTADADLGDVFLDRTRFGLARVEVCLATMGVTAWEEPARIYAALVEQYSEEGKGKRDLASESLAGLAYIAGRAPVTWDEQLCGDAPTCYARAAEVAIDPVRKKAFRELAAGQGG